MTAYDALLRSLPTQAVRGLRNFTQWLLNNAEHRGDLEPDELRRLLTGALVELDRRDEWDREQDDEFGPRRDH